MPTVSLPSALVAQLDGPDSVRQASVAEPVHRLDQGYHPTAVEP